MKRKWTGSRKLTGIRSNTEKKGRIEIKNENWNKIRKCIKNKGERKKIRKGKIDK